MSKLVLHIPGGGTRDVRLDRDRITIGRRADNDVHLPYPAVSAEHAAIITVREDSFLEDLQSTNGTLVNGKRIVKHFLRDHDMVDVGRVQLVYLIDDDEIIEAFVAEAHTEAAKLPASGALHMPEQTNEDAVVASERSEGEDEEVAPIDDLLEDMMNSDADATVSIDIPSTIFAAPSRSETDRRASRNEATAGVYLEVTSGPNTGQIAPMIKREFVLARAGATMAAVRRDGDVFALVPLDASVTPRVNGEAVPLEGARLEFGDAIEVAGVRLRFGRRAPL